MADLTIVASFFAGLVSFLSPCILPLVPAYLTFLAGTSVKEVDQSNPRARGEVFAASVFFVLGFSVVFSVLGVLLEGALSGIAYGLRGWLSFVGGAVIIIFGLMLMGLFKLDFLQREHKLKVKKFGGTHLSSFIFGAAFAAGWTPCVGAILGGVLTLAATHPEAALPLMLAYSLGLGVPFLLAGLFFSASLGAIKKISPYLPLLNRFFGLVLITLGILVMTNTLSLVANWGPLSGILLG